MFPLSCSILNLVLGFTVMACTKKALNTANINNVHIAVRFFILLPSIKWILCFRIIP